MDWHIDPTDPGMSHDHHLVDGTVIANFPITHSNWRQDFDISPASRLECHRSARHRTKLSITHIKSILLTEQ